MKKTLLQKIILSAFVLLTLSTGKMNAQANIEYTFDGATWEGWTAQAGTGAFVSTFANNPNGALEISWTPGAETRNIIMYGNGPEATLNASAYKYIQVIISNTSSQIDVLRIRGRVSEGAFTNFIDVPITTNVADSFSTYNFEITNGSFDGTLDRFQIVFRRSDNGVITDDMATIEVDNILISTSTTLSTKNNNVSDFEFSISPNPTNDILNINTQEDLNSIEIYDLLGKKVLTANKSSKQINVSALNSSMYIIKLTSNNGVSIKRFIKS
ncbi:hypothetical protein AXE80_10110 [Wenyingzhuangia fucanilytica]|uniref:Secretion system C-terminal sorting domain-containing protein n=1 Tax=Wenyingzhuangia fucanilytica TaxID=1790137 RepID=A0A1B1Y789_9FLAO|nr:T9SS type A sorting domain-containing protein [Wenyingzhuangia fucanilytica]ANW96608.1 hypothetical protein AXE80_10110 [Wenyingzhuangia fucanilytica]